MNSHATNLGLQRNKYKLCCRLLTSGDTVVAKLVPLPAAAAASPPVFYCEELNSSSWSHFTAQQVASGAETKRKEKKNNNKQNWGATSSPATLDFVPRNKGKW